MRTRKLSEELLNLKIGVKFTNPYNYFAMPGLNRHYKRHQSGQKTKGINFKHVVSAICRSTDLTEELLFSKTRIRHIVEARQISFYILRNHTNLSLGEIGKKCGGKDHSTVLHGYNLIHNQLTAKYPNGEYIDSHLRDIYNDVLYKLGL